MGKTAIITDTNSGISNEKAAELGVAVLPMPFFIDDELFYENITLDRNTFFDALARDAEVHTSMSSPGDVMDLWDRTLTEYDELVYIPMSSGLSGSCATAQGLAQEYDGKVYVVDNKRISVTQEQSIYDAVTLRDQGKSAAEIKSILEGNSAQSSIYITPDTLRYLKKGGRITPAVAAFGTVLNIKPVLQIQGDKLDSFAKVRGMKTAKKTMFLAMEKDLKERFAGKDMRLMASYTGDYERALEWQKEIEIYFKRDVMMTPLSLSISCHIGPGALAIATAEIVK